EFKRGAIGSSRFAGVVPVKGNPAEPGGHEKNYADKNIAHHQEQSESRAIRGTRQALPRQAKGKGQLLCPSTRPGPVRQSPQMKARLRQRRARAADWQAPVSCRKDTSLPLLFKDTNCRKNVSQLALPRSRRIERAMEDLRFTNPEPRIHPTAELKSCRLGR